MTREEAKKMLNDAADTLANIDKRLVAALKIGIDALEDDQSEEKEQTYQPGDETEYGCVVDIAKTTGNILICIGPEYEFSAPWKNAQEIVNVARFHDLDSWMVPLKTELNMMYENLCKQDLGGFADDYYWSSSEYGSYIAWAQCFSSGYQYRTTKYSNKRVRAVRWFTTKELDR